MNYFIMNIALALIWAAITGEFNPANLLVGFGLGFLTLLLVRKAIGPSTYFAKVQQILGFGIFFVWEILVANLRVAKYVLSPRLNMRPRVLAVPLESCSSTEITILANLISLTPGTLSLDVSTDRCNLYIHYMDVADPEAARREIKEGFERRVLEVLRGIMPGQPSGEEG